MGWSAIKYNAFNSSTQALFALDGTNRKRIEGSDVYEWGITAPSVAPTLAVGALTGLTGAYNAKYTYLRKEGSVTVYESDPSPAGAAAVTLTNESLDVTWTASADSQVTHVRVYRTLTSGAIYYVDQDIATGTVTADTNTADTALGTEIATDHDRPPLGSFVGGPAFDGTCFIILNNLLYFCKPKQPEYWPTTYYIEVSTLQDPGKCMVVHNGIYYYLSEHTISSIQGTGNETFFPVPMESLTGTISTKGAVSVHGLGIFHVAKDGLYLYDQTDRNITQGSFRPIFRGERTNGLPGAANMTNCWLFIFENRLYLGYPGNSDDYSYTHDWEADDEYLSDVGNKFTTADSTNETDNCFTWEETQSAVEDNNVRRTDDHDFPNNILVFNLDSKRTSYYHFGPEFQSIAVDNENDRIIATDTFGFVWHLEDTAVTEDDSVAIPWEVESKAFTLQTRRHFPRWLKYDVDASDDGCTATGALIMDGASQQTHTITGDRVTKRRLVATGNGKRCSIRISGSGPVKIFAAEGE